MSLKWNRHIKGISGSRWSCYETCVKDRIEISWEDFKKEVVRYNPVLKDDNWIFKTEKEYLLPMLAQTIAGESVPEKVIEDVPYLSQLDNPHTEGRYWGSDPDRKDETPDGCWMNELPGGGFFGREAQDCPGPMEMGCIRPGSCNVTSLFMLIDYFDLRQKPPAYPGGLPISDWLRDQPFSPTWLYVYMMDHWGRGEQKWDGVNPTSAFNSIICARGDYMQEVIRQFAAVSGKKLNTIYTTSSTFSEYKRAIDEGSPLVINSTKLHHVILGTGYAYENDIHWIVAHDPYGKKRPDLSKWVAYNGCGDSATHGKGVRYPFNKLDSLYMLYCRKVQT